MRKRKIFDVILDIILILITILIIYWLIKLILGGSPDLSQFNSALIVAIIGFIIKTYREIGEIKVGITYSFSNAKRDINSMKTDVKIIKNNIVLIKKKLKI